ncbi:MAG TPA: DUF2332 domain-containing protein [Mycobacteriales bacterium]|nr:DUF2332 domain-containing protein [Mycobacteriales bacterium]
MGASNAATDHHPGPSEIARRFAEFGESNRNYSPLYSRLSTRAARDPDLVALLADARPGQRRPVLAFAAVHHLLLGGADHRLRRFYPSLGGGAGAGDPDDLWLAFRDFCLANRDELVEIVSSRNTQTNEVGRCAGLYPALRLAARLAGGPLALVEIGSSAGLNLRVNRYAYRYSTGATAGDPDSPLRIDCHLAGPFAPDLAPPSSPDPAPERGRAGAGGLPLAARVGVDLAPVDVADDDAVRWLAACVYADQTDRLARLRAAVEIARRDPVPQVAGNALDVLPEVLAGLPADATACLLHTWVVTYFPREARTRLVTMLGELAARRPLLWIASEPGGTLPGLDEHAPDPGSGSSMLALARLDGPDAVGGPEPGPRWRMLGRMQAHGAWLRWFDGDSGHPLPPPGPDPARYRASPSAYPT